MTPLRVLVVDDDPDHRYLMARRLRAAGHQPDTTADPQQVLERIHTADVVVLDYRIPGTSGVDLLSEIVSAGGPPVVMVTGMGSEEVAVEALHAGAFDYVIKDSTYLERLHSIVEAAWGDHESQLRAEQLQAVALRVTGARDRDDVIEGITAGARRLLAADEASVVLAGTARIRQEGDGPRHAIEVPIVASTGEVLGALVAERREPGEFSAVEHELAESCAAFAAIGLTNAAQLEHERVTVGELQDVLDMRRQLIGAVGHELRTPLTAIAGFSATLLRHWDSFGEDERREMVARIERNSSDLTDIVTRLMDYAYIDSGRMEPEIADVALADLVRDTVDALAPSVGSAAIELDIPEVVVRADPTLLRRIVVNLLTNAYKYSGAEPAIVVRAAVDNGAARVTVTDNGPGLDAAELGHVFEPFYRAARDRRKRQGTGIGLALVRDYAKAMGGAAGVISRTGEGATFWFTVPAAE